MRFENNRRFYLIAGGMLVLLFFLGLARDLLLKKKITPEGREQPPIVIEGLDVVRDVDGARWHVKAERVERRGDISDVEVLDVVIESSGGTVWMIRSDEGQIFEGSENIQLASAVGRVEHPDGGLDWTAPSAEWNKESSLWRFPDGFNAWDESVNVTGKKGFMSMEGTLDVEEGAVVTWKRSSR